VKPFLPFIVLISAVLLTSCGGGGEGDEAACRDYWFGAVGIGTCLPDRWDVLDRAALDERGTTQDVLIAFQTKEAVSGQFPTVTVTREPLASAVDAAVYSEATIRSVSVLPHYKLIDRRTVKIAGDGGTTVSLPIHIFSAQPVNGEPQRRFYQLSTVHGKFGYTLTALTPLSVESSLDTAVQNILSGITFEAPEKK
jgi:hypothetical protein